MRDLEDRFKLSVRGIQESAQAWDDLVAMVKHRLRWRTFEAEPSRVTKQAVVNAVALYLGTLPREERVRIVSEGMALLDRCMASDEPVAFPESAPQSPPGGKADPTREVIDDPTLPASGSEFRERPRPARRKRAR